MRTIVLLFVAALVVGWQLWKSELASSVGMPESSAAQQLPRYVLEGVKVQRTDPDGIPTVRLEVARAEYFDDRAARLQSIAVQGLSGTAAPWSLRTDWGEVPVGEKRLLLHLPVSGTGLFPDGEAASVKAGSVWVDEAGRSFSSIEPVTLTGTTREARAQGFSAGFNGKTLKLKSVEMRYAPR